MSFLKTLVEHNPKASFCKFEHDLKSSKVKHDSKAKTARRDLEVKIEDYYHDLLAILN